MTLNRAPPGPHLQPTAALSHTATKLNHHALRPPKRSCWMVVALPPAPRPCST